MTTETRRRRVRVGVLYTYQPVGCDVWSPASTAEQGQTVRVVNMHGCPRANTMGHCHVQDEAGRFLGLVLVNSLTRE